MNTKFNILYALSLLARFADHLDTIACHCAQISSIGKLNVDQTLYTFTLIIGIIDEEMLGDTFATDVGHIVSSG
jgi:hypothetical protein